MRKSNAFTWATPFDWQCEEQVRSPRSEARSTISELLTSDLGLWTSDGF